MTQYTNLVSNSEFTGGTVGSFKRAMKLIGSATISASPYLTVTSNAVGGNAGSIHWATSGKMFFSATANTLGTQTSFTGLSLNNATGQANDGSTGTNGVLIAGSGRIVFNNTTLGLYKASSLVTGDVVDVAYDATAQLVWARVNGGNWNNSGTANPATGTGGYSAPITSTGKFFAAVKMPAVSDQWTFNFGDTAYTYAAPAGFNNYPTCTLPTGWTANVDPLCNFIINSITTTNGLVTPALTFTLLATNSTGSTVGCYLRTNLIPVLPSTAYVFQLANPVQGGSIGTCSCSAFAITYTDALRSGASSAFQTTTFNSSPFQKSFTTGASAAFADFEIGLTCPNSAAPVLPTMSWTCPMFLLGASVSNIPYIPTTGSSVTMDWRQFTATGTSVIGGGGGNDPPSTVTSLAVEVWGYGAPAGATTSSNGAGGGGAGAYARKHALSVALTDTISWTMPAVTSTANTAGQALSVLKGGTTIATADGGAAASNQTGGLGGLVANSLGDVLFAGGNGGVGVTAGGGGGSGGGRYSVGLPGQAAVTTVHGSGGNSPGFGAGSGQTGGNSGLASTAGGAPGGSPGGNGANNATAVSGSRGEVWIGWVVPNNTKVASMALLGM
jgi:hypothetical protein